MAPFDLIIEKNLIEIDEVADTDTNNIDRGKEITYRLDIYNDGPARNDIAVNDYRDGMPSAIISDIQYSPSISV